MPPLSHLHSITSCILDAKKNAYGELFAACDELYKTLLQITGIDTMEEKNRQHFSLNSGNAIVLTWAAMCIKDIMRTKRFMDGIYEAASDMLQINAGRAVHILYAGTGPFATLVLPLTARFSSSQLQFTLLEVNETSFTCLKKLSNALHLEKYIHRLEKADATKWIVPPNEQFDIFICETMQQGLKSEPQVAICMNIVPQLPFKTIIIPEQITLKAALIDARQRAWETSERNGTGNAVHLLGIIFTLNREGILRHAATYQQAGDITYRFPETAIVIPANVAADHAVLYAMTEIIIYKQERLLVDESPLTMPLNLAGLSPHQLAEIKFQYHTGKNPGLQFSIAP